jgi:hypothetical protein
LSFFERAWASRRTEVSVFDVIPILELVRAQPFDKVYPSDLHVIGDWAHALRRSIHAYDVVPIRDYAYASRGNVVHAYDIIQQSDTATRSGNVTLSVTDILSISEWFFRVNKALKIFEGYIPYELATASAIPAIYADDLFIIYDLGASVNVVKVVSVFDKLITDYVTYTKSYSPLFFSILRRKVPIVYKTLNILDVIAVKDSLSTVVVKTVPASDYIGFDSVSYTKSYSPLFFSILRRRVPVVYKTLSVLDIVAVRDGVSVIPIKVVSVFDVVPVADRVDVKNIAVHVSDFIMYDYVPSMSTSDVKYRSLYANVGMRTISVLDRITPYESVWVGPRVITVNARDYLVSDGATVIKRSVNAYDVIMVWENVNIVRL